MSLAGALQQLDIVKLFMKVTRLQRRDWCNKQIGEKEIFDEVIFTDESTAQLEHHRWNCLGRRRCRESKSTSISIDLKSMCEEGYPKKESLNL